MTSYEEKITEAVNNNKVGKWDWLNQHKTVTFLEKHHLEDIHDVAVHFGLLINKPYSDEVKVHCINPKHDDNNPSMSLWRSINSFKCWSCGYSGKLDWFIAVQRRKKHGKNI